MIEIIGLRKKYGKREVIKSINLKLEVDTYGLVGPNGAGKTTLIRMLGGIIPSNGGKITNSVASGIIGYLPQKFGCFPELTLYEQMEYFACLKNVPVSKHQEEIMKVLKIVNMEDRKNEKCRKLSGGMVRRAGIAQALLGEPVILLLDEPTVGLDPEERNNFNNIIRRLEGKTTILLSTHLIEDIKYLCQKLIVMEEGEILTVQDAQEIAKAANGRVFQIEESKIEQLPEPYYVERYFTERDKKYARVLLFGENSDIAGGQQCEPDIEDGYLYFLKGINHHE
ncbi:putative ABC transporter ATP-binding protein YbhF [Clostridiales bacterium CHKCI001]|nr:putative ABC transporter ATP-binding protein YbhF [Clostridiales bacterium CHKCI001]